MIDIVLILVALIVLPSFCVVVGGALVDRFINGRPMGHAPPEPTRNQTNLDYLRVRYLRGADTVWEFEDAVWEHLTNGTLDKVRRPQPPQFDITRYAPSGPPAPKGHVILPTGVQVEWKPGSHPIGPPILHYEGMSAEEAMHLMKKFGAMGMSVDEVREWLNQSPFPKPGMDEHKT